MLCERIRNNCDLSQEFWNCHLSRYCSFKRNVSFVHKKIQIACPVGELYFSLEWEGGLLLKICNEMSYRFVLGTIRVGTLSVGKLCRCQRQLNLTAPKLLCLFITPTTLTWIRSLPCFVTISNHDYRRLRVAITSMSFVFCIVKNKYLSINNIRGVELLVFIFTT